MAFLCTSYREREGGQLLQPRQLEPSRHAASNEHIRSFKPLRRERDSNSGLKGEGRVLIRFPVPRPSGCPAMCVFSIRES